MKEVFTISLAIIWLLSFFALIYSAYKLCITEIERQETEKAKFIRDKPRAPLKIEDIIDMSSFKRAMESTKLLTSALKALDEKMKKFDLNHGKEG